MFRYRASWVSFDARIPYTSVAVPPYLLRSQKSSYSPTKCFNPIESNLEHLHIFYIFSTRASIEFRGSSPLGYCLYRLTDRGILRWLILSQRNSPYDIARETFLGETWFILRWVSVFRHVHVVRTSYAKTVAAHLLQRNEDFYGYALVTYCANRRYGKSQKRYARRRMSVTVFVGGFLADNNQTQ